MAGNKGCCQVTSGRCPDAEMDIIPPHHGDSRIAEMCSTSGSDTASGRRTGFVISFFFLSFFLPTSAKGFVIMACLI